MIRDLQPTYRNRRQIHAQQNISDELAYGYLGRANEYLAFAAVIFEKSVANLTVRNEGILTTCYF